MNQKNNISPIMQISESELQKQISDLLSWNHIVHWRQNSGALKTRHVRKDGIVKEYFIRFIFMLFPKLDMKFADIGGVLPDGRFFAIEIKKQGRRPDKMQEKYLQTIRETNGVALWADNINNVIRNENMAKYIRYY